MTVSSKSRITKPHAWAGRVTVVRMRLSTAKPIWAWQGTTKLPTAFMRHLLSSSMLWSSQSSTGTLLKQFHSALIQCSTGRASCTANHAESKCQAGMINLHHRMILPQRWQECCCLCRLPRRCGPCQPRRGATAYLNRSFIIKQLTTAQLRAASGKSTMLQLQAAPWQSQSPLAAFLHQVSKSKQHCVNSFDSMAPFVCSWTYSGKISVGWGDFWHSPKGAVSLKQAQTK